MKKKKPFLFLSTDLGVQALTRQHYHQPFQYGSLTLSLCWLRYLCSNPLELLPIDEAWTLLPPWSMKWNLALASTKPRGWALKLWWWLRLAGWVLWCYVCTKNLENPRNWNICVNIYCIGPMGFRSIIHYLSCTLTFAYIKADLCTVLFTEYNTQSDRPPKCCFNGDWSNLIFMNMYVDV